MIKVMSLCSGARTRRVYGWISIVCFTSAFIVAVSEGLEVQTIPQMVAQCGQNLTLTCETTLNTADITLLTWMASNKSCEYKGQHDPAVLCESTAENSHHRLSMTLLNVTPHDEGNYTCKLRSKVGAKANKTVVTVTGCFGSSNRSINGSQAECRFSGVYPSGTVHWFQGDVNLTADSTQEEERDQHGHYNIWSKIDVQKGNLSQPYKCSLWVPSIRQFVSTEEIIVEESRSSGNPVSLQWVCMLVAVLMKFMT